MPWTLRLPDDLERRLEEHCQVTAATKHGTVVLALEDYLGRARGRHTAPPGAVERFEVGPVSARPQVWRGPDWRGGKP